jgi:hypothetical protein
MPPALIQRQLCNPTHLYHIPPLVLLIQHLPILKFWMKNPMTNRVPVRTKIVRTMKKES